MKKGGWKKCSWLRSIPVKNEHGHGIDYIFYCKHPHIYNDDGRVRPYPDCRTCPAKEPEKSEWLKVDGQEVITRNELE